MHGVDWNAVKAKYQVLVPYAKTRLDLNYIIGEMIGELNCGHAYVNPGEVERPNRIKTGLLGAEISRDKSGFFRLEKILPGASWSKSLRSPLTEPGIEAKAGEFIVAIDGVPTNSVKDMYSLLVGKAGVPTEILLNSKPQLEGALQNRDSVRWKKNILCIIITGYRIILRKSIKHRTARSAISIFRIWDQKD